MQQAVKCLELVVIVQFPDYAVGASQGLDRPLAANFVLSRCHLCLMSCADVGDLTSGKCRFISFDPCPFAAIVENERQCPGGRAFLI